MKIKTSELQDVALDWAVASAKGYSKLALTISGESKEFKRMHEDGYHNYSTDWAQGGPIIEREGMCISRTNKTREEPWAAYIDGHCWIDGPTPLIAAMRCYVASKLGDEVDVPKELL